MRSRLDRARWNSAAETKAESPPVVPRRRALRRRSITDRGLRTAGLAVRRMAAGHSFLYARKATVFPVPGSP